MQELTQMHRLRRYVASAALLHLAEAVYVDVAFVDAKTQTFQTLDGPPGVASIIMLPVVPAIVATIVLAGALAGGVFGLTKRRHASNPFILSACLKKVCASPFTVRYGTTNGTAERRRMVAGVAISVP